MEVDVRASVVLVTMTVNVEEVFVGTTLADPTGAPPKSGELWRAYGEYLLRHIRLTSGGQALSGRLLRVEPPKESAASPMGSSIDHARYELEYFISPDAARGARLEIEQDALTEILYAPGNSWTASYVVRIAEEGVIRREGLLLDSRRPLTIEVAGAPNTPVISQARIWREYFWHGVRHILTGYDHLLFVTALALASVTLWDLVKVVSAFTIAHTLTLVLSVLDLVRLPAQVVEPMISASIVFVAVQNIFFPSRARGWLRLAAAFGFGLFHGLGFAGGLLDAMAELPATALASALSSFSLGVEVGHQCVVLPAFLLVWLVRRQGGEARRLVLQRVGSAMIALAGCYYLFSALRVTNANAAAGAFQSIELRLEPRSSTNQTRKG